MAAGMGVLDAGLAYGKLAGSNLYGNQSALMRQQQQGQQGIVNTEQAGATQRTGMEQQGATQRTGMETGSQQAIAAGQQQGENYRSGLQYGLGEQQLAQKGSHFNSLFGYLTGLMGNGQGQSGVANTYNSLPGGPNLPSSQLYTDQQGQQLLNQQLAGNAGTAEANKKANGQQAAARGFGGNSPLVAALNSQQDFARMGQDAQARTNVPMQLAQANAGQANTVAGLANQAYSARLDAASRQNNALIAALSGLQ